MPVALDFTWRIDPNDLGGNIASWGKRVWQAIVGVANRFAAIIEARAKAIAPWNDITGAARQGLRAFVEAAATSLTIFCVTSVFYGLFLEMGTRFMGPRPAIMPAMESQYGPLMSALRAVVS